jgi:hypothetical protein
MYQERTEIKRQIQKKEQKQEAFKMDEEYPMKIGLTKEQWEEAVEGFGGETIKHIISIWRMR